MKSKFEQRPHKLMNNFAAAFNDPTIHFPDSDTLGGAAVLSDNGNFTFQVKEPVYDYQLLKDPIISEVDIVPMENGGGIIKGLIDNDSINTDMNPIKPIDTLNLDPKTNTETETKDKKNRNIALAIISVLILVVMFLLMRKK